MAKKDLENLFKKPSSLASTDASLYLSDLIGKPGKLVAIVTSGGEATKTEEGETEVPFLGSSGDPQRG